MDDLVCDNFTVEVKITNHNSCGGFGLLLRVEEETWASGGDMALLDHWIVYFDPGYSGGVWQLGARVDGTYLGPGIVQGSLPFGTGVPHYIRVILDGQSAELWHRGEGDPDYSHIHTLTVSGGPTEGYVALATSQSAKLASYDDVVIYAHETPVEESTWGRVKALYRIAVRNPTVRLVCLTSVCTRRAWVSRRLQERLPLRVASTPHATLDARG